MTTTENVIEKKKLARKEVKEPSKFKVIVCNDDVTPVEFVIAMLIAVFNFDEDYAMKLTLQVHHEGSAVAGVFTYEIAEQKGVEATGMARGNGFPLVIKIEEV